MDVLIILILAWVLLTSASLIILYYLIKNGVREALKARGVGYDHAQH